MINSPGTSSSNLVVQDPSKQKPLQPFQQPGKKKIHTFHQLQQYLALCVPAGVGVDCMCARVESSVLCVQDRVLINKPPHKLGKPKTPFISTDHCLIIRRLQGDVVYLGWPIAPSYMSPNAGGGGTGLRGLSQWEQLYTGAQINFGDLTRYLTCGQYTLFCFPF